MKEQPADGKDGLTSPDPGWREVRAPPAVDRGGRGGLGLHGAALGSPADIDECVTGIHNCSINETCFNIQGSFRCLAFECPENYRRSADT